MIVTKKEFSERFIYIRENYVTDAKTGKTYAFVVLDEPEDAIQLIDPVKFEDNLEKIEKGIKEFAEKLKKEMDL